MAARLFVIVSGLPGSGKSTLAAGLAPALGLPWIDKDSILEALFGSLGAGDHVWRERLSRASDEVLYATAALSRGAVLDNWWHHDTSPQRLRQLDGTLVEIFCDCPAEIASTRFHQRSRHAGRLDPALSDDQQAARVAQTRDTYRGPLKLGGPLISVDASVPCDAAAVAGQVVAARRPRQS